MWLATPLLKKQKSEIDCEYYSRNEGKHSGQLPQCYLHFVALLRFIV